MTKLLASSGAVVGTYPAVNSPQGIAFDGANIWVANAGNNTVTKLLASTGAIVGSYHVGNGPRGVAFDGNNIWVTNANTRQRHEAAGFERRRCGYLARGSDPHGHSFRWRQYLGGERIRQ